MEQLAISRDTSAPNGHHGVMTFFLAHDPLSMSMIDLPHLGHKYESERSCVAEDDEGGDEHEGGRLLLAEDKGHGHAQHAHDGHVVHGDAHVLGVVEGWDLDLAGLPGKKGAEELKDMEK